MLQKAQRILGSAVFLAGILFGMHVAGQTSAPNNLTAPVPAPPAANPSTPDPTEASAAAAALSTLLQSATPPAAPSPTTDSANPTEIPPPTADAPIPAFGAAAAKAADGALNGIEAASGLKRPTPKPKFVPSEVETIIPGQVKVGDPRAILHTSLGDITIHLFSAYAPNTVHNFIDLARGDKEFLDVKTGKSVRRPFYNNLIFHRVISGFLIQTGCPFGNGHGGPGYTISDEISPILHFGKAGMIAMAPERKENKPVPNSAGSQFFITMAPMEEWNGQYTVFGEVERGMNVVEKLGQVKTGPTDRPIKRIFLYSVEIFDDAATNALHGGK